MFKLSLAARMWRRGRVSRTPPTACDRGGRPRKEPGGAGAGTRPDRLSEPGRCQREQRRLHSGVPLQRAHGQVTAMGPPALCNPRPGTPGETMGSLCWSPSESPSRRLRRWLGPRRGPLRRTDRRSRPEPGRPCGQREADRRCRGLTRHPGASRLAESRRGDCSGQPVCSASPPGSPAAPPPSMLWATFLRWSRTSRPKSEVQTPGPAPPRSRPWRTPHLRTPLPPGRRSGLRRPPLVRY